MAGGNLFGSKIVCGVEKAAQKYEAWIGVDQVSHPKPFHISVQTGVLWCPFVGREIRKPLGVVVLGPQPTERLF